MDKLIKKQIKEDRNHYCPSGKTKSFFWRFSKTFSRIAYKCLKYNRLYLCHSSKKHRIRTFFYRWKYEKNARIFGFDFLGTKFGRTPIIYHQCLIINPNSTFGDYVVFHGNNVVGQKNNKCPHIGDRVEFGIGSTALGDIHIPNGCIIGANALVIKSPSNVCFLIGVPAKEKPFK